MVTGRRAYAIEGALLAGFMVSACAFTIVTEHPRGLLSGVITAPLARRLFEGVAMGLTAVVLIYSRWGMSTGAHMNPAVTLALHKLRGLSPVDTAGYVAGQFVGGLAGMALAAMLFGRALSHSSVNWVATRPGHGGVVAAFAAETMMTLLLMTMVLRLSTNPRWARMTGIATAVLLAVFITFEAPISGMSLNPARTLGPAIFAGEYSALWIYFLAPPLGMRLAVALFSWRRSGVACPHGFHGVRP
ncbi:MAG TPA: aquaporin [Vicinamibacterales bacterium]